MPEATVQHRCPGVITLPVYGQLCSSATNPCIIGLSSTGWHSICEAGRSIGLERRSVAMKHFSTQFHVLVAGELPTDSRILMSPANWPQPGDPLHVDRADAACPGVLNACVHLQ